MAASSRKRDPEKYLVKGREDEEEDETPQQNPASSRATPEVMATRRIVKARRPRADPSEQAIAINPFNANPPPVIAAPKPSPQGPGSSRPSDARVYEDGEESEVADEVTSLPTEVTSVSRSAVVSESTEEGVALPEADPINKNSKSVPKVSQNVSEASIGGFHEAVGETGAENQSETGFESKVAQESNQADSAENNTATEVNGTEKPVSVFGGFSTGFASSSFSFGTFKASSSFSFATGAQPSLFGASLGASSGQATTSLFGSMPSSGFGFGSTLSSGGFPSLSSVFGSNAKAIEPTEDGADLDAAAIKPSTAVVTLTEVPVETGEESEGTVCDADATLYEFSDQKWKERGKGRVRLNLPSVESSTRKFPRIVMRSNVSFRLVLNANLYPGMTVKKMDGKGVNFSVINAASGSSDMVMYALRFKDPAKSLEFIKFVETHNSSGSTAEADVDGAGKV